jgi:hypothetical protein
MNTLQMFWNSFVSLLSLLRLTQCPPYFQWFCMILVFIIWVMLSWRSSTISAFSLKRAFFCPLLYPQHTESTWQAVHGREIRTPSSRCGLCWLVSSPLATQPSHVCELTVISQSIKKKKESGINMSYSRASGYLHPSKPLNYLQPVWPSSTSSPALTLRS